MTNEPTDGSPLSGIRLRSDQDADSCIAFLELLESHDKVRIREQDNRFLGGRRWQTAIAEWKHGFRWRDSRFIGPLVDEVKASLANHRFGAEMCAILDAIVTRFRELDRNSNAVSLLDQLHGLGYDVSSLRR